MNLSDKVDNRRVRYMKIKLRPSCKIWQIQSNNTRMTECTMYIGVSCSHHGYSFCHSLFHLTESSDLRLWLPSRLNLTAVLADQNDTCPFHLEKHRECCRNIYGLSALHENMLTISLASIQTNIQRSGGFYPAFQRQCSIRSSQVETRSASSLLLTISCAAKESIQTNVVVNSQVRLIPTLVRDQRGCCETIFF